MKSIKAAGTVIIVCGIILFFVSLFADYIGVGDLDPDHFTFGHKQIAGMILGLIAIVAGFFLWRKK